MAIVKKRTSNRPSESYRQIKRAVELAHYPAYVANSNEKADDLKNLLNIEGDAVGTLNVQELFNKTQDGGTYS